jgi:hypothetical protein
LGGRGRRIASLRAAQVIIKPKIKTNSIKTVRKICNAINGTWIKSVNSR